MPTRDRKLWNSAEKIVAALELGQRSAELPRLPLQHQSDLLRLRRQYELAQQRGWQAAAKQVQQAIHVRSQWLVNDLQQFVTDVRPEPDEALAAAGDIYRDVLALMAEFEAVDIDRTATTVSVVTDRIVLEDIDLGPFQIVWNWSRHGEDGELQVIPQEPVQAAADHQVCHPHLRRHTLCLGDAEIPLQRAFRSGRLYDAFLIVQQVLKTYNPSSPHVALSEWFSGHCTGCDQSLNDSDSWVCETCGDVVCDHCHASCHVCGNTLCHLCETICSDCDEAVCRECRPVINHRRSERCSVCHQQDRTADEDSPDHDPSESSATPDLADAGAAVLTDSLGQAHVPAGCR